MEALQRFIERFLKSFERHRVFYAFTGALAASFYGVPRTTVDVDVIVYVYGEKAKGRLLEALREAGLKAEQAAIDKALRSGYRIATFMDTETPYSVDVILSKEKFGKKAGRVGVLKAYFQTPEDLVLAKLRMIRATMPRERAQKDVDDIKAILKFARVNLEAVRRQAEKEGTIKILEEITAQQE